MSWDVPGYPDTVATAPESQVQEVLSVLGCPRMSWDIPTQGLQPLSPRSKWSYMSWDVPGCPGIYRHRGYSPESQVQVVLYVLGCPRMSWDIPTQWLQPLSPRSEWSYLSWNVPGCPGMSQDVLGYPDTVATAPESQVQEVLSVLECPRMSWDILTLWLQPLSPRSKRSYLSWDVPGCPGISRHRGYSPESQVQVVLSVLGCPGISRHRGYSP